METITMNNVIDLIEKAMKDNYVIDVYECCNPFNKDIAIFENPDSSKRIYLTVSSKKIHIITPYEGKISININDKDLAKFNLLYEEIKEYRERIAKREFNNFFIKEDNRTPTIDELNDED